MKFIYKHLLSESYKLSLTKWAFFAFVLDEETKQGIIQIDYSYGYNNGTKDFKVRALQKLRNALCPLCYPRVGLAHLFNYCV